MLVKHAYDSRYQKCTVLISRLNVRNRKLRETVPEQHKEYSMNKIQHTFSDMIAGYVTSFDGHQKTFELSTSDKRLFTVHLTDSTYLEIIRNLGEPFQANEEPLECALQPQRYLYAYGIFYPENNAFSFEAKHIVFVGQGTEEYRVEEPYWWVHQIKELAEFYIHAQFPDGNIDYRNYRTHLTLEGAKIESTRQETDTISRMIYGFATAYMLTGEDRYLEAAEKGTEYLREHMRAVDENENVVYWYHAMDVLDGRLRKIFSSQFGDDYEAIPAYEQIYALAGPIQTYRITGDPRILADAKHTINLFNKFFLDKEKGGYFSHIDPVSFSPWAGSLGQDRARKNWNSVGDHIPAYLINLWLATNDEDYADMMVSLADTIESRFPDDEASPFVQERFRADWSHDQEWNWQQNRAVVGHNLKIAWNLMRVHHLRPNHKYTQLAKKISQIMPSLGMDLQRGGWYDVMEREREGNQEWNRLVWHNRKAWWQQEQAILAYLILAGSLREDEHKRLAREATSFYNAFFLDHDNGGVYFNVLAEGIPYLVGTERLKGSHSMSGYHSFELCYLAAVYSNLLINSQPMDFYFKTKLGMFKDDILRVQPDLLPSGSIRLQEVWINDQQYSDFDPIDMAIRLPTGVEGDLRVRAHIVPTGILFDLQLEIINDTAHLTLYGTLNDVATPVFKSQLDQIIKASSHCIILHLENLTSISSEAARALSFVVERLTIDKSISITGANEEVRSAFEGVGVWEEISALAATKPNPA